jgi:hypothetical protein
MDINDLRLLWTTPANQPSPQLQECFLRIARARIDSDRRKATGMMRYVLVMATLTTIFSARQVITSGWEGLDTWYAHLMLAATWAAALLLIRQYRQRTREAGESIRATLESLCDRSRRRLRESFILLCLFVSFIPLLALAIGQLQLAGKMRPHEAQSAATMAAVILLAGIGWFTYELLAVRRPELRHLESMLNDYKA